MSVLLPFVVAPAAVALIFGNVFGDRYGLVNAALGGIGLAAVAVARQHAGPATSPSPRWSTGAGPATTP